MLPIAASRHIREVINFKPILLGCTLALAASTVAADSHDHDHDHIERTIAPEGAMVYIISPVNGETVSSPVTFQFGARGIGIAPAGVEWPDTGHHHLLINVDPEDIDMTQGLLADDQYRHFGGGQTEATLDLPAGTHTFMLLMGDHFHVPHDPPIMSEVITVTVE